MLIFQMANNMIAKIPTNCRTLSDILDAVFEQTKKEYDKLVNTLETTLRFWRALDERLVHRRGELKL